MDQPTRQLFGGIFCGAVFMFLAILAPKMPAYLSVPGLFLSAAGATWCLWPWLKLLRHHFSLHSLVDALSYIRLQISSWRVDWHSAAHAVIEFSTHEKSEYLELRNKINVLWKTEADAQHDLQAATQSLPQSDNRRLGGLTPPPSPPEPPNVVDIRDRLKTAYTERKKLEARQEFLHEMMIGGIQISLQLGHLIARGYIPPHTHGRSPRLIPTHEWSFLRLTFGGERPSAKGGGIEYLSLQIGKSPKWRD